MKSPEGVLEPSALGSSRAKSEGAMMKGMSGAPRH